MDNTPKPAATALHNLTTILSDPGSSASNFTPGGLAYSVSGLPSSAYSLLTQKSDSSYQIVVWNEPNVWNDQTHQPISAASSPVTVQLGQVFSTVQIFDPLKGSTPVQTLSDVSSVALSVADHPFIIQVSGAAASSDPSTATSGTGTSTGTGGVATTVGTGPDMLVLKLSEDAYKGDAQYTVSVDGQQVGGILTAHGAHADSTAQDDTVTVQGSFGAGPHTVSVNFLNDLYDGQGNDRNLYVDAASYNGTAVANSSLAFFTPGSQQFAIPGTGATGVAATNAAMTTAAVAAAPAAPTVALSHDTGTGGAHVTSDGSVTYAPSVNGDTLHYKLDTGTFTTTAPVLATDGSADGQHTVTVYETNAAGLTSADATLVFNLDSHHLTSGVHTL